MFLCIIWKHKSTLYLPHDICLFVFFFFSRFTSRLFLSEFILLFVAQCTFKFGMFKLFLAYKIHQNIRAIEPYRITIKKKVTSRFTFLYTFIYSGERVECSFRYSTWFYRVDSHYAKKLQRILWRWKIFYFRIKWKRTLQ